MNSNRNSTVSGGFISKQSNGTDRASSAEPIKCTGQSGVSSAVPIKHYHPLRCQACFLDIFISQSVQSPLRNINSPFGFHGAVNLSFDSNKRFMYDVVAYNSDDGNGRFLERDGDHDESLHSETVLNRYKICLMRCFKETPQHSHPHHQRLGSCLHLFVM
ncbi:hypothetical protein F2Q69_00057651 [Brassica cretica]|uniref:Uncharacterized protein n=1 Tax=Brassica cretica TaxID=69181 RepID=A0A8S9MY49_BRACR|nr:hypothetical protein F2Q69_00057651 [Brassica cretica]